MARESDNFDNFPLEESPDGPPIGFYCEQAAMRLDKTPMMFGERITIRISTVEDMPVKCGMLAGAIRTRCEMLGRHFSLKITDRGGYMLIDAVLLEDGELRDASASKEKVIAIALRISVRARSRHDGHFNESMEVPFPPVRMSGDFARRVCHHLREEVSTLPYERYTLVRRDGMLMVRCEGGV